MLMLLALVTTGAARAATELVIIGEVEEVQLLPVGVVLPARIDTGAAETSLAARELKVKRRVATFRLPPEYDGALLSFPLRHWVRVRSNLGLERRPVVEMQLCVGSKRIRTLVNLDDRQGLHFPLLIGRDTLGGNFLVDVQRSRTQAPHCLQPAP